MLRKFVSRNCRILNFTQASRYNYANLDMNRRAVEWFVKEQALWS